MARKWTIRVATGALLAGGIYVGVLQAGEWYGARTEAVAMAAITDPQPRPLELSAIEVIKLEPTSMVEEVRVSGELRPLNRAMLRAKAAGTVTEVNVRPGQRVNAGDVLVRFDTADLQSLLVQQTSSLAVARVELERAQQTFNRAEQLTRKGVSTKDQLEKAQSDMSSALAKVEGISAQIDMARTALANAEVKAPFDGVAATRSIEPGSAVAANAELITLVDTSIMEVEVLVSTRDIVRIRQGQNAELRIDGLEDQPLTGTVDRINPVAEDGSRFVRTFICLQNPDLQLWGGMFATGSIRVRQGEDILVLPAIAVREDEAGPYVLRVENGRLSRRTVTVKSRWNGGSNVEVAGVSTGDLVVTSPLPEFRPGVAAIVVARAG